MEEETGWTFLKSTIATSIGNMATTDLICWKCGTEINDVPVPISRREECPKCVSSLRACMGCDFYDANAGRQCAEPQADPVADPESGNTCDYFRPRRKSSHETPGEADEARAKLNALFGDSSPKQPSGLANQADAYKKEGTSEADEARAKLNALFGDKD